MHGRGLSHSRTSCPSKLSFRPVSRAQRKHNASRRTKCPIRTFATSDVAFTTKRRPPFPFTQIAGQDELKLALLLCVVDPSIGGCLIMGDRGCGKSVAVRSLVEVLPDIDVVPNDKFNSSPVEPSLMGPDALRRFTSGEKLESTSIRTPLVELPLGATEDRICGTIDIEKALSEGVKAFEPGLLARANRGILYVDEVNLLDNGLVDVVLDSAAGGINTVEREGISVQHPAKFIMVGSGNPAEGELRPQLLDRFGLTVNVGTLVDTEERVQMVLDRISYDIDSDDAMERAKDDVLALRKKIMDAKALLGRVKVSRDIKIKIASVCSALNIDGLRGDLVVNRTARALVAFEGRSEVTTDDVARVLGLCLNHRLRKDVLDDIDTGVKVALAWRRIMDPAAAEKAELAKKEAEQRAEKAAKDASKKKGAWSGLPV